MLDPSPFLFPDHLSGILGKLATYGAAIATILGILWQAGKRLRGVVATLNRFVDAVETLERLVIAQSLTHQQVASMFSLLDQAVWRADKHGLCTFANLEYQRLVGRSFDELQGSGWHQIVAPAERLHVVASWRETVAAGGDFAAEFTITHPLTGNFQAYSRGYPLYDTEGTVAEYIGTTRRITPRS